MAEGFNLIGSQFLNVGATVKDVNDFIVDGSNLLGLDAEGAFQTTMRVWTGNGYDTYGWLDLDDGTANDMPEWNNSWVLYDGSDLAKEAMDIAKGVWLVTSAAGEITVSGEVATGDTYTIDVVKGFNIIANPFPCSISIQDIQTDLAGIDAEGAFSTTIRVWTGNGYDTFAWLDADDGTANDMPEWDNSWVLYDGSDLAPVTLKVGEAIWFVAPSAGKVTFTK